jgi:hypothetical protein
LIVLAAFGLDEMAREKVPRWWILGCAAVSLAFLGLISDGARAEVHRLIGAAHHHAWAVSSVGWAILVAALIVVVALFTRGRTRSLILVGVVAIDAVFMFGVPELSAPRSVNVDIAPISFLQKHLGDYRFYSIGPVQPNYGSYFGVSSLDVNDLPVPKTWVTFVSDQLDHNAIPYVFNGAARTRPVGPTALQEFTRNFKAFEMAGVKYLVVPTGTALPALPPDRVLRRVFSDNSVQIYQLPSPSPTYSTRHGVCSVKADGVEAATVSCSSPQTLIRRELYLKGWSATLNGRSVEVSSFDDLFQQIQVPAGTSEITFNYTPPHILIGYAAFLAGVACLAVVPLWRRIRRVGVHGRSGSAAPTARDSSS